MGCLRRRFMPRPPHRLQQKSRAWLSRETACEQAARQERHDRRWRGRHRLLASASGLRGAFQEEAPNALVMSFQSIRADQVKCWCTISDARWPLPFITPSAPNPISISVGMRWLGSLPRAC